MNGAKRIEIFEFREHAAMTFTSTVFQNPSTFRSIESRLANFNPPIVLRDHIIDNPISASDLTVHPLLVQGIDFTLKDPDKFLDAIDAAKTGIDKAFSKGSTKPDDWKRHWALSASLLATKGIGYREPWRFYLNDRATQLVNARPTRVMNSPTFDNDFAGNFGEADQMDLSALHISVAYGKWTACNIHVDHTGIAMMNGDGDLSITPNVGSHFIHELLFQTIAGEHLPTWFIDRVKLHFFSPELGYRRLGVSYDVLKGRTYKLTVTASCGLTQCDDIQFSKILRLDKDALKSINPTISFTKRF
jgi:hypothetical protein